MAYATETALSLSEAYDKLISFMTGHGWTIFDDIPITGSRDKVLFSTGTTNKLNMYYRISSNLVGGPYKDPQDAHNVFPYIYFRGYHNWNPSTHSGSGEFGNMGPIIWAGEQYSNSGIHYLYPFLRNNDVPASPLNATVYNYKLIANPGTRSQVWDGRRKMWHATGNGVGYFDIATPDVNSYSAGLPDPMQNHCALVKDALLDKEYVYVCGNNGDFRRFDIESTTFQTVTAPPWGIVSTNGGNMVHDGGDFIYLARGAATTSWARYSISQNTWTSLAVMPVALPSHTTSLTSQRFVYIPNAVTGFGEDVIYALLADTGTIIYRYDVTSNVWRSTTGTGALTAQDSITAQHSMFWDRQKHLYFWHPNTAVNLIWRSDLSTAPNTWTNLGSLQSGLQTFEQASVFNQLVAKVRTNNVIPGKCFFHGDADGVRMVYRIGTNPGAGRYYWAYLGKYDTAYRADAMGLTAPVSPGVRVLVQVDSLFGYAEGQDVTFANWSGSHFEKSSIYQFSGSNAFFCNLTSSFPSGSKVAVDPAQHILTGDSGLAVAPISYNGYEPDFESDWYNVKPELPVASMDRHSPSTRQVYVPMKFVVYNGQKSTNSKYETLGFLRNVFSIPKKVYPAPQNEDILVFGNESYIYFNQQETSTNNTETRGIVIGPL